ncbi:predicted protein [Nematostella vectensis]|uniref:HSF-type DNA-binding domain-containing protein n=1 Tax=Nematostella vectensis TaxID=45351 RepID=A7ST87_NEMVE|nr:uncharacterized protein LOC5504240 [Nematostella vectensis]EDO33068.1 predicted protein [Nematostella vectensis]|eukprot:XP_001625168.1 predicted protein [Nematostella vectensis]
MANSIEASLLSFPEKLWFLVSDPKCEEITWNDDGTSILIPNHHSFTSTILNSQSIVLFKTNNFASFVRQLNLYGFRKVTEHRRKNQTMQLVAGMKSEFKHPCFKRERKDLLQFVRRQTNPSKKGGRRVVSEEGNTVNKEEKPPTTLPQSSNYRWPTPISPVGASPWVNWDTYLQTMGMFPYLPPQYNMSPQYNMPPMGAGLYGSDQMSALGPYYGRDLMYTSQYRPSLVQPTDNVSVLSNQGEVTEQDHFPAISVTSAHSKPAVVIINNTLSASRDVTKHGFHSYGEETRGGEYLVEAPNSRENKTPFPVQTDVTSRGGSLEKAETDACITELRDKYDEKAPENIPDHVTAELDGSEGGVAEESAEWEKLASNKRPKLDE